MGVALFFALPPMRVVMSAGVRHVDLVPLPECSSEVVQIKWTGPYDFTLEKIKKPLQ